MRVGEIKSATALKETSSNGEQSHMSRGREYALEKLRAVTKFHSILTSCFGQDTTSTPLFRAYMLCKCMQ